MAKCVNLMSKSTIRTTFIVCLHVCDLFLYARVNVNMYFETVLFLEGLLSH